VRLVLVGTAMDSKGAVTELARILGIADRVELTGWVTDERLRELYRAALALVHPSRYEGFAGLQPLEAMAQGTPVIALDASGATEALTGAAELVHTEHAEELADAMCRLARDEHTRVKLGAIGRERIRDLTWEVAAARFVEVLRWIAAP
jgi:glycosyltransferase involved in cell wall biosynthesis